MNDRRLTPGAVLCLLDVSVLSALGQQFGGGCLGRSTEAVKVGDKISPQCFD
jgi:hypothetical protein